MTIDQEIHRFIVERLRWDAEAAELTLDYPLLERRTIDSLDTLRLIDFIEEKFAIRLADEDVVPTNFATLRAMTELVARTIKMSG